MSQDVHEKKFDLIRNCIQPAKPGRKHAYSYMHEAYIKKLCATLYRGDGGISNIRYMYGESLVFSKQRNKKCLDFKCFIGYKLCNFLCHA